MKLNFLVAASLLLVSSMSVFSQAQTVESAPPAPESGNPSAIFERARALLAGKGVPKDVKKAFELMKVAADQGNADAIGGLGYFYSVGLTVPKDEKLAAEYFRKGAEKGSAKARLNLGKWLLDGKANASGDPAKDREEGLQWIKKAADQNLPEAALAYGSILYFGDHGVAQDYGQAAPYMKIAADSGNPDAQNIMGVMCETGLGVSMDTAGAEQWFRKAALQGHLKAQSNLGRILGPSVENRETRIEAVAWLMIASADGEVTAEKLLSGAIPGLKPADLEAARSRALELRKTIRKTGLHAG